MAEHTEEALAARLVETYSDRLLRLAYSILNSVPDAQDVCQEVLLKRLEYPGAFENEKHEQAWMVRVTVNACKNVRRSPWRTRTVGLDAVAEPAAFHIASHRITVIFSNIYNTVLSQVTSRKHIGHFIRTT